ncbi:MAG: hypothetical protein AAGI68_03885 [Planctomycetota bacterium]
MKIKRLMMRLLVVLAMLAPVAAAVGAVSVSGSAMAESGCHSTPPPGGK